MTAYRFAVALCAIYKGWYRHNAFR